MSIEAMKQALEALEGELPGWLTPAQERAIESLRQAIEQAEKQEPVALKKGECWPEYVMEEWDYWRKQIADGDKSSAPRDWFEELAELKLVTAQPQREWVGLMRGVRVDSVERMGDTVVISVKGGNDAARQLCAELVAMIDERQSVAKWAVFCGGCRKEWSVPYQHPGKSICAECEAKLKEKNI